MFSNFKSKIYKMDSNNPDVMIIGNYYGIFLLYYYYSTSIN